MFPILKATDDAEARGDAVTALEVMAQHPVSPDGGPFWRPERLYRLAQIAAFGELLPGWATSRWILAQAATVLDEASRTRGGQAMDVAIRARVGLPAHERLAPFDHRIKVMDHDWVYRQAVLYELNGLEHFLTRVACPDLVVGADRIEEWMRTPMGGFRFVGAAYRHLAWERLGTGERLETVNLGAATLVEPGDCVIGRPVPIEGAVMWESAPQLVPEAAAVRVAADPAGWVDALAEALPERREQPRDFTTHRGEFGLLTDVPDCVRLGLARLVAREQGARQPGRSLGDQLRDEARQMVLAALAGDLDEIEQDDSLVSPWPSVAASLLEPGVVELVVDDLSPGDATAVATLADKLAGPASGLCRWIALDLRESA